MVKLCARHPRRGREYGRPRAPAPPHLALIAAADCRCPRRPRLWPDWWFRICSMICGWMPMSAIRVATRSAQIVEMERPHGPAQALSRSSFGCPIGEASIGVEPEQAVASGPVRHASMISQASCGSGSVCGRPFFDRSRQRPGARVGIELATTSCRRSPVVGIRSRPAASRRGQSRHPRRPAIGRRVRDR